MEKPKVLIVCENLHALNIKFKEMAKQSDAIKVCRIPFNEVYCKECEYTLVCPRGLKDMSSHYFDKVVVLKNAVVEDAGEPWRVAKNNPWETA